jgi:hypothetical protein
MRAAAGRDRSQDACPERRALARELPRAPPAGPPGLQAAGRRSRRPGPVVDADPPCPKGRGAGGPKGHSDRPRAEPLPPLGIPCGASAASDRGVPGVGGPGGRGRRGERWPRLAGQRARPPLERATPAPRRAPSRSPRRLPRAEGSPLRPAEWRGRCGRSEHQLAARCPRPPRERSCTGRDTDARALPPLLGSACAPRRRRRGSRPHAKAGRPQGGRRRRSSAPVVHDQGCALRPHCPSSYGVTSS